MRALTYGGRRWLILPIDLLLVGLAWMLAYQLRFNFELEPRHAREMLQHLPVLLLVRGATFSLFGFYRRNMRYYGMEDLKATVKAIGVSTALFVAWGAMRYQMEGFSRAILIIEPLLCLLLVGGMRVSWRLLGEWKDQRGNLLKRQRPTRVIIYGAGRAGELLLREIRNNREIAHVTVGFVDDNPAKRGLSVHEVKVLGSGEELPGLCERLAVDEVFVAAPSADNHRMRTIIDNCRQAGRPFKTLPSVSDLLMRPFGLQQLREVRIDDLLGRKVVQLDVSKMARLVRGKNVLVTGAAGSIGSELVRQILALSPKRVVCFDQSETGLFDLDRELESHPHGNLRRIMIGDVLDSARLNEAFSLQEAQVVFHAAAYKHVPMMESNESEAVKNNVLGTLAVGRAAIRAGCEKFVLVSTDKAVNPANVMGATKRLAELAVAALQAEAGQITRFVTVRFGNVLGSSGSVVPLLREMIAAGGPVKVTHPEVTRYFMTIPEACQLVLTAGAMGEGGEIYVLDMGEPVRILDLARDMIRLSGLEPDVDVAIEFCGLRPGEKLHEQLAMDFEALDKTSHRKIRRTDPVRVEGGELLKALNDLGSELRTGTIRGAQLRERIMALIPQARLQPPLPTEQSS